MTYQVVTKGGPLSALSIALILVVLALAACSASAPLPPPPALTPTEPPATPSPSVAIAATPTAEASHLPSELAPRLAQDAMSFLRTFTQELSPRTSATQQEKAAADYLAQAFAAAGYQAVLQPFTVELPTSEVLIGPNKKEFENFAMRMSGTGKVSGTLTHVNKALQEDIPPGGLAGKIALIQRGEIPFEQKVARVAGAGAIAAIVYNNVEGPFGGTLQNQARIPTVSISRESGEALLLEMTASDHIDATVSVNFETYDSQNVIAEKAGAGSSSRVVILGGHYDTVPGVPGANDNGSGIATLVTIAREVSKKGYPFTLRFIAFGSEELGLVGSRHYVDSLSPEARKTVVMMLNFDALATGSTLELLGDSDLATRAAQYGQDNSIATERRFSLGGASSDYAPFQVAEIPFLFFLSADTPRMHTPEDKLEFVEPALMGNAAALAMALLDSVAAP